MLRTLLKRKETFWGIGFMTCLSLFAEEKVSLVDVCFRHGNGH